MKKLLSVFCLVFVSFLVVSCASKKITDDDLTNDAFETVYNAYKKDIILEGAASYVVKQGDFLAAITNTAYGSGNGYYFPLIMLASDDVVLDPDLIEPGMELTIPDLQRNLNDPTARRQIKAFLNAIADVYDKKDKPDISRDLRQLANTL
jgi:hypothetical protein